MIHCLCRNVEGRCLYHNWNGKLTVVLTIENIFYVILEAHAKGGHPKGNNSHTSEKFDYFVLLNLFIGFLFSDVLKNKNIINDDLGYYGVPFNAVKTFIHTCPMCVPNKVAPKRTKMEPLKMILSKKVGSRFQMDLIEMPPYQDYCYILRVVDHLSKYGYVRPIKARSSHEVGNALLSIVSTSITPRILQSDNGGEVSG